MATSASIILLRAVRKNIPVSRLVSTRLIHVGACQNGILNIHESKYQPHNGAILIKPFSTSIPNCCHGDDRNDNDPFIFFLKKDGLKYRSIDLSHDDIDFINLSGLILNDSDEKSLLERNNHEYLLMNQHQRESEQLLMQLCIPGSSYELFLADDVQSFWLKLCSSSHDNTVYPEVFRFNALNEHFGISYETTSSESTEDHEQWEISNHIQATSDLWQQLCSAHNADDATIKPNSFSFDDIQRKFGIYKTDMKLTEIVNQILREENAGIHYFNGDDDNFTPFTYHSS